MPAVTPDIPDPPKAPPPRNWGEEPLPPYRYVPLGRHPHPTMDTGGHMQVKPPAPTDVPSELAWMTNRWWLYGVDLFNNWYFWEAHEVWEPLWSRLDRTRPPGQLIQGLMMCCGALLKLQCEEVEGVLAFSKRADAGLAEAARARKVLWGLKTGRVHKDVARFFAPVLKKGELPSLDKRVPRLVLKF